MNIFEYATRNKIRFTTERGNLTVEDLWDLPLISTRGLSLDQVGRDLRKAIRENEEESLVEVYNPIENEMTIMFNIVKHIIDTKQQENINRKNKAEKDLKIKKLEEILARKTEDSLNELSIDDIQAEIEKIRNS